MSSLIDVIFVPQGAEYQAVVRGLRATNCADLPQVVPLAIGPTATTAIAQAWLQQQQTTAQPARTALLMGLCGSLQPQYPVGAVVLCDTCWSWEVNQTALMGDRALNAKILARITNVSLVSVITSEHLLYTAQDKKALAQMRQVEIVEMEGYPLFKLLQAAGLAISMLRVVSDNSEHDLPDISNAIAPDGSLRPIALAVSFLRNPRGAARLIRGSLTGLQQLEHYTSALFKS